MSFSTICAVATGTSNGAVSIIRLSGARARTIASSVSRKENWTPRRQVFCTLYDGETVLDKALVTYFQAPHSFTGEDVVEFAVHGSPYIKGRLLEILCELGAVPAQRGEFSQRAFLNGKMDLVEAQGLCDLIASGNKAAHDVAMSSLDGKLSAHITEMKTSLSELLAQIEVRLDDVDEEMTPLAPSAMAEKLTIVLKHIQALVATFSVGRLIKEGLKIAIVGAPNSGKSSLLNTLVGFDRAIVSDQSGTTRDTVEEMLEINGQKIILTDTAGIRDHALDPAEQEGMRRSKRAMEAADVILLVLDGTRGITSEEKSLWKDIQKYQGKRVLIVHNKADKATGVCTLENSIDYPQVTVSCKTGEGIDTLKNLLTQPISQIQNSQDLLISNLRHYEALLRAQTELEASLLQLEKNAGGEIYAEHIRAALTYLQDLIGEVTPDDVLGIIFSKFCMGK